MDPKNEWVIYILIFICIVCLWIWVFCLCEVDYEWLSGYVGNGDMVFFKSYDQFYGAKMMSYFTHVGMVIEIDGRLCVFEANPVLGVGLYDLRERVNRCVGNCYIKKLKVGLTAAEVDRLLEFCNFAVKEMWYETDIAGEVVRKLMGRNVCGLNTNCAELMFLTLQYIKGDMEAPWYCHYIWWCRNCNLYEDVYYKVLCKRLVKLDGTEVVNVGL